MKRLHKPGAAFLSVCLFCTMSTAVFASGNTELDETKKDGDTTIVATTKIVSDPAYEITIPSAIPVGEISKTASSAIKSTTFEVSAAKLGNLNGKEVNVKVSTAEGNFNLSDGTNRLPYQVFNQATEGTALASGDLFTSFTADGTVTGRVDIDQVNIMSAGEYTGTLTFTIALADSVI